MFPAIGNCNHQCSQKTVVHWHLISSRDEKLFLAALYLPCRCMQPQPWLSRCRPSALSRKQSQYRVARLAGRVRCLTHAMVNDEPGMRAVAAAQRQKNHPPTLARPSDVSPLSTATHRACQPPTPAARPSTTTRLPRGFMPWPSMAPVPTGSRSMLPSRHSRCPPPIFLHFVSCSLPQE